jgi:hypothetical protein
MINRFICYNKNPSNLCEKPTGGRVQINRIYPAKHPLVFFQIRGFSYIFSEVFDLKPTSGLYP